MWNANKTRDQVFNRIGSAISESGQIPLKVKPKKNFVPDVGTRLAKKYSDMN